MGFLKNVAAAFKPSSIKQGLAAYQQPIDPAVIQAQVDALPPEHRAAYEANMAQVAAAQAEAMAGFTEAKALSDSVRVLDGPAGRYLYGQQLSDPMSPDAIQQRMATEGISAVVSDMWAQSTPDFGTAVRQTFNRPEVPEVTDPAERARVAAEQRAGRDAARAPYRDPTFPGLAITRIATRGKTQLAEVVHHLDASGLAARPDLVYGLYRVPDRISQAVTPQSERGRVVEWDIVHHPFAPGTVLGPTLTPTVATSFPAEERWVARRRGEPSVLDEDLGLAFLLRAGIGPERTLGIARVAHFRALRDGDSDSHSPVETFVEGVAAFHGAEGSGAYPRMQQEAPLGLEELRSTGVHVEVLNWEAVGMAVHPKIHHPPPVPSAFGYLPATPQELLRAYFEVVGVRSSDCYSAQATVADPQPLQQGGLFTTNVGPQQPCADGKARMRSHGCQVVVVAYRDCEAYAAGRARWAAYQRDVLQAHLERGVTVRPPVVADDLADLDSGLLRAAVRASAAVDWLATLGDERPPPPYRYCWPPIDVEPIAPEHG